MDKFFYIIWQISNSEFIVEIYERKKFLWFDTIKPIGYLSDSKGWFHRTSMKDYSTVYNEYTTACLKAKKYIDEMIADEKEYNKRVPNYL